jgi:hypothetical protein
MTLIVKYFYQRNQRNHYLLNQLVDNSQFILIKLVFYIFELIYFLVSTNKFLITQCNVGKTQKTVSKYTITFMIKLD